MASRRASYTAEFKLQTVRYALKNGNRAAGREFNVDEKMVRNWRKNESALELMPRNKRANRTGSTKFPQLENDLSRFIREKRASGRAITTVIIRRKAKEIAKERGLTNFVGGPSWCNRFMKRVGLSIRENFSRSTHT